jgi:hypothetical protein
MIYDIYNIRYDIYMVYYMIYDVIDKIGYDTIQYNNL